MLSIKFSKDAGNIFKNRLITVSLFCLLSFSMLLGLYYYRIHLYWFYAKQRIDIKKFQPFAVKQIHNTAAPYDWVRCQVSNVEFSLPPELATNRTVSGWITSSVIFAGDAVNVIFTEPLRPFSFSTVIAPVIRNPTFPEMDRLACQTDINEFRWSMTDEEATWLLQRIKWRSIINERNFKRCEWFRSPDLEGFITYSDGEIYLRWQSDQSNLLGSIEVLYTGAVTNDTVLMHGICGSLRVLNTDDMKRQRGRN